MNNFLAYFLFILGLCLMIVVAVNPDIQIGGWLGIIFVVWGLHSIISNIKKEILEELNKKNK